jgi:hypothetical protein
MKIPLGLTTLVIGLTMAGCTTSPYGGSRNNTVNRTLVGVGAGTAVGAAAGAALGGGVLEGAVVGAVAGGAIGAVSGSLRPKPRVFYRDTNGSCYYVDDQGRSVYDREASC